MTTGNLSVGAINLTDTSSTVPDYGIYKPTTTITAISAGTSGTISLLKSTSVTGSLGVSGALTAASINGLSVTSSTGTLTLASSKTLVINNSLTFYGTDSTAMTFPSNSTTVAGLGIVNQVFSVSGSDNTLSIQSTTSGNAYFISDSVGGYTGLQGSASGSFKYWMGSRGTNDGRCGMWVTSSAVQALMCDTATNVFVGTSALSTSAIAGFFWVPSSAGAPTGAASEPYTNAAALHYDSTNHKIYVRCGGTWKSTAALT